jgi:GNAT superfamily N-acetyltransferase
MRLVLLVATGILLLATRPTGSFAFAAEALSIQIRPVQLPSDLPSIQACRRLAYASSPASRPLRRSEQNFVNATSVAAKKNQCLVAVSHSTDDDADAVIVHGSVDFKYSPRTNALWIENMFVAPNCRGQGIARRLLCAVEQQARSSSRRGVEATQLQVYTSNAPAMALYRSSGYRTNGIHAFVEAFGGITGANLLVTMTKQLKEPSPLQDWPTTSSYSGAPSKSQRDT